MNLGKKYEYYYYKGRYVLNEYSKGYLDRLNGYLSGPKVEYDAKTGILALAAIAGAVFAGSCIEGCRQAAGENPLFKDPNPWKLTFYSGAGLLGARAAHILAGKIEDVFSKLDLREIGTVPIGWSKGLKGLYAKYGAMDIAYKQLDEDSPDKFKKYNMYYAMFDSLQRARQHNAYPSTKHLRKYYNERSFLGKWPDKIRIGDDTNTILKDALEIADHLEVGDLVRADAKRLGLPI